MPALRTWHTDRRIAHAARRQLLLPSLAPVPRTRRPRSVPGARTGVLRTPRAITSCSRPSLLTPAHHTWRMDRRIVHAAHRHLLLPSTLATLPSKTGTHQPVVCAHTASLCAPSRSPRRNDTNSQNL
ncbi:hypothetical protein K488DRAFT_92905 [Vararia minispora EC-137]|uniref:Uncharacterized protein n=1 Tax=Vararia minispora EC-137 TaxID=1314806 RepID=A0ACB8Q3T9_9AGAM|nr:hypothetical protein K488DRAFT_92905 [Vararia minispora EC-137]